MGEALFTKAGQASLRFPVNPSYPGGLVVESGVVNCITEGGGRYAYKKSEPCVLITLRFSGLPASAYDGGYDYAARVQVSSTQSLVNWFLNVCSDRSEFSYSDPFGKTHAVTIEDDRLLFSLADHELYDGTITLRKKA
jgi:hypothetical protein